MEKFYLPLLWVEKEPEVALTSESNIFKVVQKDLQKTIGVKAEPEFKYLKGGEMGFHCQTIKCKFVETRLSLFHAQTRVYIFQDLPF